MLLLSDRLSRLRTRFRRARGPDVTQESPLLQPAAIFTIPLPPEINNMILSYVPLESVIALALTCRFLLQSLPSLRLQPLDDEGRFNLLGFLEKDPPHLYACHQCLRLHTWPRIARRPGISEYGEALLCRIKNNKSRFDFQKPPDYQYGMSYALARLITNRHLYGEQHGPPMGVLNRSLIELDRLTNMGIRLKQSWNARIIDDELYLEATVQVYHKEGHEGVFRKCFDEVLPKFKSVVTFVTTGRRSTDAQKRLAWKDQGMELLTGHRSLVCHHLDGPGSGLRWRRYGSFRELDIFAESGDALRPRTGKIMSCRYCFTDFRGSISRGNPLAAAAQRGGF